MVDPILLQGAILAAAGKSLNLSPDETVDLYSQTARRNPKGIGLDERRRAEAFDFDAAGVPAELGGFGYANAGADVEFGVDQADWQIAAADDKDIEARDRRRAQQAALDVGLDARMRSPRRAEREAAVKELAAGRAAYEEIDGRTDWRMQQGSRIKEDPFIRGKRGADHNLVREPGKVVRRFGRERFNLEREPQFPLGFEDPEARNNRQRGEIAAERRAAREVAVRADAQARGQLTDAEIGRRIRQAEVNANANANVAGMAPRGPVGGGDSSVTDVDALRREIIARQISPNEEDFVNVDEFGKPKRNLPARQEFQPFSSNVELALRDEAARRADIGIAAYDSRVASNRPQVGVNAVLDLGGIGNLERLGNIRDVGNLKMKMEAKAGGFNEGQFFPTATQRSDLGGVHVDANGMPLAVQGPDRSNIPGEGTNVNAPQNVQRWMIQNAPQYRDGGRVFGDFPQVGIGNEGDEFLARLAGVRKGRGANAIAFQPQNSHIRNIADLQAEVDAFVGFAQDNNIKLFNRGPDGGEVLASDPDIRAVFQKVKMNDNAQARLANAMFQLEAGRGNNVNPDARARFEGRANFVREFDEDPGDRALRGAQLPEFGNDEAQLQKVPRGNIQVGVKADGTPVMQDRQAALQGLRGNQANPPLNAAELRDARNGLAGLVQGEGRGNFGFAKPIPEGADAGKYFRDQAIARAKPGKQPDFGRVRANVAKRQGIIDRAEAAEKVLAGQRKQRAVDLLPGGARYGGSPRELVRPAQRGLAENMDGREVVRRAVTPQTATSAVANPTPVANTAPSLDTGSFQERAQNATTKLKEYATSPKYRTGRRIGYGVAGGGAALAGLASLIGGERDRREEEQYR